MFESTLVLINPLEMKYDQIFGTMLKKIDIECILI